MNEEQMHFVAKQAAKETIKETFEILGVNAEDFEDMRYFRKDLVWLRKYRRFSEKISSRILITVTTILTGGFVYGV